MCKPAATGFTLAELLISVLILGVIATFSIPKVLIAQQKSTFNAKAKEAIGTISEGIMAYKLNNPLSATISPKDLLPFLNYINVLKTLISITLPGFLQ